MSKKRQIRNSPKAIIIRDGKLLTIRKRDGEHEFFVLPGGGQRAGTCVRETLERECTEELGVEVAVGDLLFVREYIGGNHEFAEKHPDAHLLNLYFACELKGDPADISPAEPDRLQVGVDWLPLDRLSDYPLYPAALKRLLPPTDGAPVYLGDVN